MSTDPAIIALSIFTLVAVLGYGVFNLFSVKKSQARRGEDSDLLPK